MKYFKLWLCIAVSLLICTAGYADEGSPAFFTEAYFTKPQSPDAWAMTRYGEASLDLFHGTAGLTVPVYTYQDKDFTIPVSLSYASTGFMPGAAVGAAGLGWSLNTGGVITREVRGMPDDESNDYSWKWLGEPGHAQWQINPIGLGHYEEQMYGARSSVTVFGFGKAYDTQSANLSDIIDMVYTGVFGEEYMAVQLDTLSNATHYFAIETQPDVFHFSFLGRSGSFILCPDGTARVFDTNFPAGDLSVEFVWSWETPGNSSFILRTGDGYRYDFALREDTSSMNQGYSDSEVTSTSAWKLTKVTAPCGRTAVFNYNTPHDRVSHGVSLNVDHRHTFDGSTHSRPWQDADYMIEHPEVSDTYTSVQERSLSSIVVGGCCTISFSYAGAAGEYALQSVTVKNGSGTTVRSCTLTQSGSGTHRFLKGITIPGEGTHSFSYYNENSTFPDLYTRAVDLYGYYTGSTAWTGITHTDNTLQQYASSVLSSRSFSASGALMGMLQTVTWPTGGNTSIEYEQNRHSALMRPDNLLASDSAAAGLRVKSLTSYDTDGSTILQTKSYIYETSSGRSSGVLLSAPELYWKYSYVLSWGQTVEREGVRSQNPLGFGLSSHIEYPRVVERITDGGTSGPSVVREFESTYGPLGNVTSRERYAQQPSSILETPQDSWTMTFTPVSVHIPESVFLSGGIHAGNRTLEQTVSAQGLTTAKTETSYGEYPSGSVSLFSAPMVYIGHMFDHEYHYRSGYTSSSTGYLYDLSGSLVKSDTSTSTVDSGGHVSAIQTTDSKGAALRTEITYHSVCTGTPVRVSRKRGSRYVGGMKMDYTSCQNPDGYTYLLPGKAYRAYSRQGVSSESGLTYREVMSYDHYDTSDNLLQMTDSTGKVTGIAWDSSGMYPVKVGENMTGSQTASASSSYSGHLLTRYSWTPLVGLSSVTDPSGRTTCYSYDSAGRLTGVTAPDGSLSAAWAYNTATDHIGYNSSGMYNGASLQLPQGRNWILNQTFDSSGAASSDVSYFDALGYPLQDLAVRASGDLARDLVVPHVSDYLFREPKEYLPYPVQVSGSHGAGAFVSGAVSGQNSWYCSRYSLSGDACGYSETGFEEAPGGRPLWSRRPGKDYYSAAKKVDMGYGSNSSSDAVKRLDTGSSTGYIYVNGTYGAGTLVKTSAEDEDGRTLITFTDNEGHTVLERRLGASGGVLAETYYAWDEFGRLRWVVQPEGSALLTSGYTYYNYASGNDAPSRAVRRYSFIYYYSNEDKVIEKSLAGTKDLELTYSDDNGLLESLLDGNLASDCAELVYSYDGLNRLTQERLADNDNGPMREYYYDTYPSGMPSSLSFTDVSGITTAGNTSLHQGGTAGLLTAERLAELDADGRTGRYAWRAHYYDILGNCIQTVTLYPDGKLMRESSRYDLRGNETASCSNLGTGQGSQSLVTSNTFDARGRLIAATSSLNGSQVSYAEITYDLLGRPAGTEFGNGIYDIISYNIRGQETRREVLNEDSDPVFSSVLRYTDTFNNGSVPSWTGNISSWTWEQAWQSPRTYDFGYDGLDRLTSTAQYQNSSLENKYGEDIVYDCNGNITSLVRRNGSSTGQSFSFSYTGNMRSAWSYDSNGNVTSEDPDTEYPVIVKYNVLNLPGRVTQQEGFSTKVLYLADGSKLSVTDDDSGDGYIYYGGFRCSSSDGSPLDAAVSGGRLVWKAAGPEMHYFTTDHLGSVRVVTDPDGNVLEQFDYLPYGEKCNNSGLAVANQYKTDYLYTGKELPQFFGLDWYDSIARWQTTSGVFTSPDPLAEKYYSVSPYAYCKGDPVNRTDPDGLSDWDKVAGAVIGVVSNVVPGAGSLRDLYRPTDFDDYNNALRRADVASLILGGAMISTGGGMDAIGSTAVAGGAIAIATVAGAPEGAIAVAGGAATAATGAALVSGGMVVLANAADNVKDGYNRGNDQTSGEKKKPASYGHIQRLIEKGQAPKSFESAHKGHGPKGKPHIHLKNGSSFNLDGSKHDTKNYKGQLTNEEKQFIREQGWNIPE